MMVSEHQGDPMPGRVRMVVGHQDMHEVFFDIKGHVGVQPQIGHQ